MHNPTKSTVAITVSGETYRLAFDFEAIAEAEELTGRALITGLRTKDVQAPTIVLVRSMLFACLRSADPEVTFAQAKALVNRENIAHIWGKVLEAWTLGLAEPDPEEAEDANPPKDQN